MVLKGYVLLHCFYLIDTKWRNLCILLSSCMFFVDLTREDTHIRKGKNEVSLIFLLTTQ